MTLRTLALVLTSTVTLAACSGGPGSGSSRGDSGPVPTVKLVKNPVAVSDFTVTDLDGRTFTLSSLRGKVVLVNFWATWCGPCRGELPFLREAYKKFNGQGFDILSISLDFPERTTTDAYREWITQNGMTWRHVYEQLGWKSPLAAAYLVRGIPSPVLVGKSGQIVASGEECRGPALEKAIEKALAEPA